MLRALYLTLLAGASIGWIFFSPAWGEKVAVGTNAGQSENSVVAKMTSPRSLYLLRCSGCHQVNGAGSPGGGVPPLPGYLGPMAADPEGRIYIAHVPGVAAARLNDLQLVEVLNYLIDEWGEQPNGEKPRYFTVEELRDLQATPVQNVVEYRRGIVQRMEEEGLPVADYPWP